MRILIYDREKDYLQFLRQRLEDEISQINKVDIICCDRQIDLICMHDQYPIDYVFMDISVHSYRGLEFAHYLHRLYPQCQFVFIYENKMKIYEIISLSALFYLKKPYKRKDIYDCVQVITQHYHQSNICFEIPIRSLSSTKSFYVDDLCYVKTDYNDLKIKTRNQDVYIAHVKTRNKIREVIEHRWFLQINRSVHVNVNCIQSVSYNQVTLHNGEMFPIGSGYRKNCLKKYRVLKR